MNEESIHLFDQYSLDLARGCLTRGGVPVHLRRQTYEVLKYLVENRGRLVSKDTLIETVWQGRAVTDGSLGKCIEEVREVLGADARKFLRNERGRGYIFDTEISTVQPVISSLPHPNGSGATSAVGQATQRDTGSRVHKGKVLAVVALIGVAALAVFVYIYYFSPRSSNINSIAVLPFVNATGDQNSEYISDGLTESLIDQLAKLQGLKVIARSSSFNYKGSDVDAQQVGRALSVSAVVTGRVVRRGDTLVVSAELVDTKDRTRLWGGEYAHNTTDLQRFHKELAQTIADKLRLRLSVDQERQLANATNVNAQAFEYYLNGLFHFNQSGEDNTRKASEYFNQSVLLDPNFALGWAWVSRSHSALAGNSFANPKDAHAKAKVAAEKALQLDDNLADGHIALARIKQNEWDWVGAEQEYKRAIALSPSLVIARVQYAQFLAILGRHSEGMNELKRAQELDPMSPGLKRREAFHLHLAGRSKEALKLASDLHRDQGTTSGTFVGRGFIYQANGMHEEAIQVFREVIARVGESTANLSYLAGALASAGRRSEAIEIAAKLRSTTQYVSPAELAAVYVLLSEKETAMELLKKAYDEHDPQLQTLKVDQRFDSIRLDPHFQDLIKRVGLV